MRTPALLPAPLLALLMLSGAALASAPAPTQPAETAAVHERVLGNGLKVLVKRDRRAPIVTSQVWYKVGSSYEYNGITGVSHLLEHMMFKGTERLGPNEFSKIIAENGGDENAFTGRDYTAYFQTLAADRLPIAFELEAERMRRLKLPAEEFVKELEVVKEERRLRTDDDPQSLTFERFNAVAYEASPYRIPIIGWASDLESMDVADLRAWYRQWYAPNNAVVVVVGDVDPEQVFALAEQHFGPLAPEVITPPKPRAEPSQVGEKRLLVKAPAKESYLIVGYKAPSLADAPEPWEAYALEMLTAVLDEGSSSRLARDLIRGSRVAAEVNASYSAFERLPGMLLLSGTPAAGQTVAGLEQALDAQIQRLRQEPVSPAELARIRTQLIADKVYELDSVFYQAMQLGQMEAIGLGWRLVDEYVDRLSEVTPEQIQMVANKYLTPDQRTVAVLDPQPIDDDVAPEAGAAQGDFHVR